MRRMRSEAASRWLTPVRLLLLALILGAAGVIAFASPRAAPAQETLTVKGRVVNGTAGSDAPGNLAVLMLTTGPDGTLGGTGQAQAGPQGRFIFDDVAILDGASYTVSVDYEGVFYSQTVSPGELSDEVMITIHEATEDAGIMRVDRQVMVISDFDAAQRTATATEFVRFSNPTDRILRPNLETARPGMFSFMRFALPPEAAGITVQSNLRGGDVISVGSGFALTAAVPPGEHSADFAYTFPYEGGELDFRNSLPQGAVVFQILIPERFESIEIGGLTPRPPVGIGNEVYRAWEGRDIPPSVGVQLNFAGLPQAGALAQIGNNLSGGSFWITAIPTAMGSVLLVFLLLGVFRRYRPAVAGDTVGFPAEDEAAPGASERAELVASLAALDERYQGGGMGQEDYLQRRAALVARALGGRPEPEV